uniref:NADH-ubiquinone oxidoreductase chain 2 n=1 Tax=Acanthopsyche nigraplaga TaxID=1765094 RepID=A0A891GS10_9NEOP|nr:NADH dehydrogenase subunit 2 [Acanthopsyche nigraplaga]QRK25803.1 NADH dehydrogenase subunit 2 [Acanthopsyche nigraplaga]
MHIMNLNKMFFYFILFFSTMISISSNSWLGCWIGLEINLLSFITIIFKPNNLMLSEVCLKYFLIQCISSMNFMFFILINLTLLNTFNYNNILSIMINCSLIMKMGMVPFHFWFPNIMEGLSWMNCFILMTWQKIAPIIILSYFYNFNFLIFIIMISALISSIGGLNQTSLRKLLAFSSINHSSWMMMSILISENLWILYFISYLFLIILICLMFYNFNSTFINQLFFNNLKNYPKLILFINLLSLGGLPPFLGFIPKWITINFLIFNKHYFLTFILIMSSLIMLIFYIRISYSSFMFNYFKMKFFNLNFKNYMWKTMNYTSFLSFFSLILMTLMFYFI